MPARPCPYLIAVFAASLLVGFTVPSPPAVGQTAGPLPGNSGPPAAGDALPTFGDLCFVPFDTTKALPQAADLRNWFDVIAGQPQGIFESKTQRGQASGIEGIVRLKSAWPHDGVLRLLLDDYHRLQIHLFHRDRGVTLVYQEEDQFRWSAYVTQREPRGVTPSRWMLAGMDGHRNRRTQPKNHGQYELRWLAGEVILTRGDVILVRAPLPGPPDDVYFQGKALILGLELVRTRDFPLPEPAPESSQTIRPADLTWNQQLDEQATVEQFPDGARRLSSADRPKKRSWTATPLLRGVPSEIILEMDEASPGAGIYLGNAKDGPRYVLRYVRDRRSQQLCVLVRHDDDVDEHEFRGLTESPLPVVDPHHWLRLVVGAGQVRWWLSPDGIHWAEPSEPIRNLPPEVTHFGLHSVSRQSATGVTLRKLEIRELSGLTGLAPGELRRLAPALTAPHNLSAWVSDVTELTPAGTDADAWRRACAIRALAANCPRPLANELLLSLLRDPHLRGLPLAEQLRIFDDASLLIDVWDDQGALQRFLQCYLAVGESAWQESGAPPFSSIRHSLMTASIATRHQLEIASGEIVRKEIAHLATLGEWDRLRRFARELRFFQLQSKAPLLEWAENLGIRKLPAGLGDGSLSKQKDEWRELLVEELNKEVYNSLAQLRVELSGQGREDAARVIAALERQDESGVAPDGQDQNQLVSLRSAVRELLETDSALRQQLANEYSEVARLRLRQAIDQRDDGAIEQIAWQFAGTEGASQAHEWLGDRALAAGQFALAWTHYRRGSSDSSSGVSAALFPKLRLAATLAGRPAGEPLTGTIELGEQRMPAAEFESLLTELAARRAGESRSHLVGIGPTSIGAAGAPVSVPPPCRFNVHRRARLEGLVGNDPNREFTRDTARRQIDWVGRQLGIAVEKQWMYVCNRFQVAAYDLQARQRVWQTPQPPGQIQFAQESTGIASRPLVTSDRIFARLLFGAGGTLVCADRATGQFIWTVATDANESFISDPFWQQGEFFLQCFQAIRTEQQEVLVRLVTVDPRTGHVWRTQEVMRLRDSWHRRRCCEVTPLDDGLVAHFAGVVVRLDGQGKVLWLRKQTVLPPDEDPQWISQWFQPPFVIGRKVIVAQPGCQSLDCLDLESGRLVWSQAMLDVERMVDLVGGQLLLQTSTGLRGLNIDDGQTIWKVEIPDLLTGVMASHEGGIVAVQRVPLDANRSRFRPQLLWLDARSGEIRATTWLPQLEEADPRIGPLVSTGQQLWTFWGNGQTDPTRDVIELEPAGAAEGLAARLPESIWERQVDERLLKMASTAVPQWRLLHAEYGDPGALLPEVHGEKDVVQLRFRNSGPVVLGREFKFPDRGSPQLRFRFGNETGHAWKVEVRFRGEAVWSEQITPQTHSQPWKSLAVDLRKLAGQEGWLTVRAWMPQGGDAPSYWKSLELVF